MASVADATPFLGVALNRDLTTLAGPILVIWLLVVSYRYAYWTNIPKIDGIPEIPGARPFLGHLHLHAGVSSVNDGALWASWAKKHDAPIFQMKYGQIRVVVANTFAAIREIFVTNARKTSDRPRQYMFEQYVGYDLGTHSLDDNFKQQRLAGIASVQPRKWPLFYAGFNREADRLIASLAQDGEYGAQPMNPFRYMQLMSMNLSFHITFDKHFDNAQDPWLRDYVDNAVKISKVRGASNTYSDFVPLLRWHPKYRRMGQEAQAASQKRSRMIQVVLEGLKERIAKGEQPNCIAASVLADENSKLSEANHATAGAIKCSTSMVQGGLESLPAHVLAGMGGLTSAEGIKIQEKAYQAILETYPNGDAAEHAFTEESVPYIVAIYKEILRNYTVLPFSLPRQATEDIQLSSGAIIPKGTTLYMNSEGGNHDEAHFGENAGKFDPERWLRDDKLNESGYATISYGVGSRLCPAWNIANRMMYGLIFRTILDFQLRADESDPPPKSYQEFGETPAGHINKPKQFRVRFIPRDPERLKVKVASIKA
ncbi:hypothetical protein A1O1_05691 [Capronia coronata CBS 617.96]|uniref:Cytochrome P450 n=1 Tax=Capronia coronata CBS 617.96 TaxID=1182541 RepID=W9XXS5_9EURO|nr:uncharacterized protein A1O1_05691 [Capronia coronata CBS 617.96]EXJ85327.1 hypothetical protein A1O1_05691 [Capronia coronata CBS 617.96]